MGATVKFNRRRSVEFAEASAHGALLGLVAQSAIGDSGALNLPPTASFSLVRLTTPGYAGRGVAGAHVAEATFGAYSAVVVQYLSSG